MSGTREKDGLEGRPLAERSMPGRKKGGWYEAFCVLGRRFGVVCVAPAADNILLNPGFEAGPQGSAFLMRGAPSKAAYLGLSAGQALW